MKITYCDILTINRNTTFLTNIVLKSIIKKIRNIDYHIYVVDNSDEHDRFKLSDSLEAVSDRITIEVNASADKHDLLGSIGHARTIQKFIDLHTSIKNLLVIESDSIVVNDIDFLDDSVIAAGRTFFGTNQNVHGQLVSTVKLIPCFMYLNTNLMRQINVKFFSLKHENLPYVNSGIVYDTGSNFLQSIIEKNLQIKNIDISRYIVHLEQMTRGNKLDEKYKLKIRNALQLTDYEL